MLLEHTCKGSAEIYVCVMDYLWEASPEGPALGPEKSEKVRKEVRKGPEGGPELVRRCQVKGLRRIEPQALIGIALAVGSVSDPVHMDRHVLVCVAA